MQQPVKVGIWPALGPDSQGNPLPGPLIGVRWKRLSYAEYQKFRARIPAIPVKYLTDPDRPSGLMSLLSGRVPSFDLYADVYEACVVVGPPIEEAPAGLVAWIAEQELFDNPYAGKFKDIARLLGNARNQVHASWMTCARAVVAGTFRYSFEEIDTWPPEVFFERVAQAEQLTGVPLNPADPKASPQKPGRRGRSNRMQPDPNNPKKMLRADPEMVVEEQKTFQSNRRR